MKVEIDKDNKNVSNVKRIQKYKPKSGFMELYGSAGELVTSIRYFKNMKAAPIKEISIGLFIQGFLIVHLNLFFIFFPKFFSSNIIAFIYRRNAEIVNTTIPSIAKLNTIIIKIHCIPKSLVCEKPLNIRNKVKPNKVIKKKRVTFIQLDIL